MDDSVFGEMPYAKLAARFPHWIRVNQVRQSSPRRVTLETMKQDAPFPKTPWYFMSLRWLVIVWGHIESFFAKAFPTQWQRKGQCLKTGSCCRLIGLELPPMCETSDRWFYWMKKWGIWWNERVNGFTYAGHLNRYLLGFTCNRLGADHTCMDYKNRPRVCRQYPWVGYFGKPKLCKGCGFSFSLRPSRIKIFKD